MPSHHHSDIQRSQKPAGVYLHVGFNPRIRVVARPNPFGGNPVFWAVLDEVDPGNMLILTNGTRDWPARVLEVTDTIITARDNQRTYQFARRGTRAGHIAGN